MSNSATINLPDASGHFGPYGGMFVPETLMTALQDLEREYHAARKDPEFRKELAVKLKDIMNALLEEYEDFGGIEEVYFTSFVVQ